MAKFEVLVQKIFIKAHPNADALELGNIGDPNGWQVVVKRGLFKTGDLVAYIPESAVVPEWVLKKYGFWNEEKDKGLLAGSKGDRVKMIKLRAENSLGICIPVIKGPNGHIVGISDGIVIVDEGQDISEWLGVTKYEPPIPTQLAGEVFFAGTTVGVNYDIEDFKKFPTVLQEGEDVQMTVKIHGCADYDTLIETIEFGNLKIGYVVENKIEAHVKSLDTVSNEIVYSKITNHSVFPNDKQWFLLETEDGHQIKLTGNHKVWLPELKCYREVEKLTVNDCFLID
jgi:RNA ligase (TIGR02306 family)